MLNPSKRIITNQDMQKSVNIFVKKCLPKLVNNIHRSYALNSRRDQLLLSKYLFQVINKNDCLHYSFYSNAESKQRLIWLLYESIKGKQKDLFLQNIYEKVEESGVPWLDPRLVTFRCNATNLSNMKKVLTYNDFFKLLENDPSAVRILSQILSKSCIIPNFEPFIKNVKQMFKNADLNTKGKVADYIPQLAETNPDFWGLSLCTIDGQRYSIGDYHQPFCLQSCVKPLAYALAVSDHYSTEVHQYMGEEPSGRLFNSMVLNHENKPHNPMVNSGAIVVCSLIERDKPDDIKFQYILSKVKEICGDEYVGFDEHVFLSEKNTSFRNYAIAYYLMEKKGFPPNTNIDDTMDLYLKLCAITVTCESGSMAAATLANGGVNPIVNHRVLGPVSVRNTLSLMHSCGMYDYSGKFAFEVGLPAKSGVSGGLMVIVPNVMGLMCQSPRLDEKGNSVKGVSFFREFVEKFNFHVYDNLRNSIKKSNPRELGRDLTDLEVELAKTSKKLLL